MDVPKAEAIVLRQAQHERVFPRGSTFPVHPEPVERLAMGTSIILALPPPTTQARRVRGRCRFVCRSTRGRNVGTKEHCLIRPCVRRRKDEPAKGEGSTGKQSPVLRREQGSESFVYVSAMTRMIDFYHCFGLVDLINNPVAFGLQGAIVSELIN